MSIRAKNNTTCLTGDADEMTCVNFAINASLSYGVTCLPTASYSDITAVFYATFQRQSFLKLLKMLTIG